MQTINFIHVFILFLLQYNIKYDIIVFRIILRMLFMQFISDKKFDRERELYGVDNVRLYNCDFDGPADGESALKESNNIKAEKCSFNLRYPFWHDRSVDILECNMSSSCRAPIWYSSQVTVKNSVLHGVKALRECSDVTIVNCDIDSLEFGWFSKGVEIRSSKAKGEYFMLKSENLKIKELEFIGKYSFQYVNGMQMEDCVIDTKDAFWHARNVYIKNCVVKGEYLAWYSENITFENCVITGTQPLCYCKGLRLINCEMHGADLAFERSALEAYVTTPMISIKNPLSGKITVPCVDEVITEYADFDCEIVFIEEN